LSGAIAKLVSINLRKLVLSPTGSINLGFILREDLLLCSSYLPLGVPNWAVIYTPSVDYSHITPEAGMVMKKAFGGDSPLLQGARKSFWTLPISRRRWWRLVVHFLEKSSGP
jgi:hypothetical protein